MERGIASETQQSPGAALLVQALALIEAAEFGAEADAALVDGCHLGERIKGAAAAAQARATVELLGRREAASESECRSVRARADRSVRAELALARRCSPTVMDRHVGVAKALASELPATMGLLRAGRISEKQAFHLVARTACLTREDREVVDELLAPDLPGLSDRATQGAAERAAAEADNGSVARRHSAAVKSRRVSVRPAPDGMARLSVLGPLVDVIGAWAALTNAEKARAPGDVRGKGAWLADKALELLSGRSPGQPQPVEVAVVMTDQALLPGVFDGQIAGPDLAQVPGYGVLPGSDVRARAAMQDHVSLRRLFTSPDGRDLIGMDSKRRTFTGSLRRFLELRDPTCRVPFCDAPAVHIDHATGHAHGAKTDAAEGNGQCANHNQLKEVPGWTYRIIHNGLNPGPGHQPHEIEITTPTGRIIRTRAAPIHGWGARPKRETAAQGRGSNGANVSPSNATRPGM